MVDLESQRRSWAGFWTTAGGVVSAVTTMLVLFYLAGDWFTALAFAVFLLGMLWPASAVASRLPIIRELPECERFLVAGLFVIFAATPWFFLRRSCPSPRLADAAFLVAIWAFAARSGALRASVSDLKACLDGLAAPLPFVFLPMLFGLIWSGFAVDRGDSIAFYELYAVDFCNLATRVSMLLLGKGLPPDVVVGMVDPHYHWLYFALPAWFVEVTGGWAHASNALILCNAVVAFLLMLAIAQIARTSINTSSHRWTITCTVAVVMFAPVVTYAYQWLGRTLQAPWFVHRGRNYILLSLVNSMPFFGNNSTALVVIATIVLLLARWNVTGRLGFGFLLCLLLVMLPGYSVTLVLPVALGLAASFLLGRVAFPGRAVLVSVPVAIVAWIVLHRINVLGGGHGMAVRFDNGHYFLNFGFSAIPLLATALLARTDSFRVDPWGAMCVAALAVPTFIEATGSGATPSDLSTKMTALFIVLLTPFVARGVDAVLNGRRPIPWFAWPAAFLVLCGFANTLVYAGQFVVCPAIDYVRNAHLLPAGYDAAMRHLRTIGSREDVVLDTVGVDMTHTLWPGVRAERRVLLPNQWFMAAFVAAYPTTAEAIDARMARFREWREGGYQPGSLADAFAAEADYMIATAPIDPGSSWTIAKEFGVNRLYRSLRRKAP